MEDAAKKVIPLIRPRPRNRGVYRHLQTARACRYCCGEWCSNAAGGTSTSSSLAPSARALYIIFETVMIAPTFKARASSPAVWSPSGGCVPSAATPASPSAPAAPPPPPPPPPLWSPGSGSAGPSPQPQRKTFKPVALEKRNESNSPQTACGGPQAWDSAPQLSESGERRLPTSHSAPPTGLNSLGGGGGGRLPRAQNPTITLLQHNREAQLPRGPSYTQTQERRQLPRDRPIPPNSDPVHALRREYASESEAERVWEREGERARTMGDGQRKVDGIGPTTKEGMPVALRSEVKDPSRWYKKMYDTIHKTKYDDDYVTIRYKNRRGEPSIHRTSGNRSQYAYFDPRSGYLSEPEGGAGRAAGAWSDTYDSDATGGPRRRTASVQGDARDYEETPYMPSNKYSTLASARASQEVYKNQPGKIENYMPGRSSVIDKEAKQWWDEVMDIFDGQLSSASTTSLQQPSPKEKKDVTTAILSKSNMARALKESGYESDSTLVFRRRTDDTEAPLSPAERRAAYKDLQAGGEPPLRGFRSPAPPRQQDDSEIEYIPISPTLTKIRVHKKSTRPREVICYPTETKQTQKEIFSKFKKNSPSFISINIPTKLTELPPPPPRRVSSRTNKTLKLVSSVRPVSASPTKRSSCTREQSNVNFLKDKIHSKLSRQGTHIISKPRILEPSMKTEIKVKTSRVMSTSAPPALSRSKMHASNSTLQKNPPKKFPAEVKTFTSSFGSPRRTVPPIQYSNPIHCRYDNPTTTKVPIEGGAGRRTPITNILDRVTSLDRLWNSENRIGVTPLHKIDSKSPVPMEKKTLSKSYNLTKAASSSDVKAKKMPFLQTSKQDLSKVPVNKQSNIMVSTIPRGRNLLRSAEKLSKLRNFNILTKSTPSLTSDALYKCSKQELPQSIVFQHKSPIITDGSKSAYGVKVATITSLKKKKSSEDLPKKGRNSASKPANSNSKDKHGKKSSKKSSKSKRNKDGSGNTSNSESGSPFDDVSMFGSNESVRRRVNKDEIKERRNAVVSDSFFQHLFLRNISPPQSITSMLDQPMTSVLEKAKLFQSFPPDYSAPKSINSYLIHKKPVSQSKFKMWDRFPYHARSKSPRSISWPGRMHSDIRKFDSLSAKPVEFGSNSSLATVRSRSEPPANMMFFSQTTRPKSPIVIYHKKETPKYIFKTPSRNVSPTSKLVFSQTSRPVSPKVVKIISKKERFRNESPSPSRIILTETTRSISPPVKRRTPILVEAEKIPTKIIFTETSRPVSPVVIRRATDSSSRDFISRSPSPVPMRSPSSRRIHSARIQGTKDFNGFKKRTRSAGEIEDEIEGKILKCKTYSDPHLNDPDYKEYILDMKNSKSRSERFRELNRYYSYLERVGELERATSTSDLRHRRKDEEIIDFDRWKKIRAIERAEEELDRLYNKLKVAQKEDDVLFYPRDVKDFRWNYNKDRALKIKEKSVENLKEHFQETTDTYESISNIDGSNIKDAYTPLWRGTSVADVAYNINKKNDPQSIKTTKNSIVKSTISHQDTSLADLRRKLGLGSRLWSSLSMEQVNTLKNQLNAIYSKDPDQRPVKVTDEGDYSIKVTDDDNRKSPSLHVRCNSLTTEYPESLKKEISKSDSIGAINYTGQSEKDIKNNVNKISMGLSENDKKRISSTLSKEVLDRVKKIDTPLFLQQDNTKDELLITIENKSKGYADSNNILTQEPASPKMEMTKRYVIYPNEKNIDTSVHASSASETETASSDQSNKTVIYRPKKEVLKKVEYFETIGTAIADKPSTVYHARSESDEQEKISNDNKTVETEGVAVPAEHFPKTVLQSQSCANFKELFGESEAHKFSSLPLKARTSRSPSLQSESYRDDRYTPDTLRYSSEETLCRSRSESPDPERYWRAYLNLVKAGEVKRLARRFDSPSKVLGGPSPAPALRRYRSDPEIARNVLRRNWSTIKRVTLKGHERGDVDRLTHSYELRGRHRSRRCGAVSPVPKVPLRAADRFMPHIDVISKLAALRRRTAAPAARSRSADAPECPIGEVERIRRRFETMSLLGQMYTSTPDVRELRDIAPYLAGSWTAHRFPSRQDNNRSLSDGSFVRGRRSPVRRDKPRVRSTSPSTTSIKLSSILKEPTDVFANQSFDPAMHRPVQRYQPPPPRVPSAPPRPPAWPHHLAPYSTRPTVTFQEPDSAPTPPPKKGPHGSYSDTESPRRYVESDVNIHYRCPVRRDPLPHVPERELARRQAEHMRRLYQEERRRKYLQDVNPMHIEAFDQSIKELQDMQSRRHTDNFTPSQKSVVSLNRYDETDAHGASTKRAFARALYAFAGQNARELTFRKGDVINVRRQIDANWYEGELNGKVGLFPYNYVEIIKGDSTQVHSKPTTPATEGRARAKFDFNAQTNLELPLKKGEVVVLTRRIDQNWWEGRNGTKMGIFPDSYVTVLEEPSLNKPELPPPQNQNKPLASPASHGILSGAAKHSMGAHSYRPQLNSAALSNGPQPTQPLPGYTANYHAKPAQATLTPAERGYGPPTTPGVDLNNHEPLFIDTNAEAVPYRAMYKYRPQNPDELELAEGDTVYVLEKCDDGWYVGSSQRTGRFGTFPGNYVERI